MAPNRRDVLKGGVAGIGASIAGCMGGGDGGDGSDGGDGGDGGGSDGGDSGGGDGGGSGTSTGNGSGSDMADELVVYGNDAMEGLAVGQAFSEETGISISSSVGIGGQPTSQYLQEHDADQSSADLLMVSPPYAGPVTSEGLAANVEGVDWEGTYSGQMIDQLRDVYPDSATNIYPIWEEPRLVSWNPDNIEQAPESYDDLLRDEFEDNLVTLSYLTNESLATMRRLYDSQEQAEEYMVSLKEHGMIYPSTDPEQAIGRLTSQQAKILFHTFSGPVAAKDEGRPVDFTIPQEGTSTFVFVLIRPTDAPHPQAADRFIEWILSDAGTQEIQNMRGGGLRPSVSGGSFGNEQLVSQMEAADLVYPQVQSIEDVEEDQATANEILGLE